MPLKIPVIRQSILNAASFKCGLNAWWVYNKWLAPEKRSPFALAGAAAHHLLDQWRGDTCFDADADLPGLWDAAWDYVSTHSKNPKEQDAPISWWPDEATQYADLKADYIPMLKGWLIGQPDCKVLASELDFELTIGKYLFSGTIDRIYQTPDGKRILADFKTGKQIPTDDLIRESYQFALYALAAESLGFHLDSFAWIHLRDYIPYERDTDSALNGKIRNQAKADWLQAFGEPAVNKKTGEINGKLRIKAGMPRGPGIYLFPITPEWRKSREQLLLWASGALAQANPVPIINENCEFCELLQACRDKIYRRTLSINEKREVKELSKLIEELT